MKACTKCDEEHPLDQFPPVVVRGRRYVGSWCRPCKLQQTREWRQANPGHHRKYALRYRYGLTEAQYEEMVQAQGGVCAICRERPLTKRSGTPTDRLHVDHDPATGQVRGLLCGNCNRGIGMLQHDPERLRAALSYLAEDNTPLELPKG